MANTEVSGLDMGPTIEWYKANRALIVPKLPRPWAQPPRFPFLNPAETSLNAGRVNALVNLFPRQALERSRLNKGAIRGGETLYFHRDFTPQNSKTTNNADEALSPTAIIPSYTDNSRWKASGFPSSDVYLFQLPESIPPSVRRIIHAEGLVHEIGHTIVTQALYTDDYKLRLPSGVEVDGFDFIVNEFAGRDEQLDPVSHYASFYRGRGEKYQTADLQPIEENFVESIAGRLLGFAFGFNEETRLDPMADRKEIEKVIDQFLHAELVTA